MTGEMYEAGEQKGKGIKQNRWSKRRKERKEKEKSTGGRGHRHRPD